MICWNPSVIPSEVEESLDLFLHARASRDLDFIKRDNRSFFALEIIRLWTLNNYAIRR